MNKKKLQSTSTVSSAGKSHYDVVICGGGLAGLTLARQLKQTLPQCSVLVADQLSAPLPKAAFKVGESTVELGAHYLGEKLGLVDYFESHHYPKLGLRYFFGNSTGPFEARPEFGLSAFPAVESYQIDRGGLENDLRKFNADAGVEIVEGVNVQSIILADGDEQHEIILEDTVGLRAQSIKARWVIDAMGRRRFLQRKLGLTIAGARNHSAAWFRLAGRIDVSNLVAREQERWHGRVPDDNRYYSTNHLMGDGYWVWLIPLAPNHTSIGVVAQEDIHPFTTFNTYPLCMQWLHVYEPRLADYLQDLTPLDFKGMRRYSYSSRQVFSTQRWACVGEAGVFSDPFYSPGTDVIGFGNSITTEMIRRDLYNEELTCEMVQAYNEFYLGFNDVLTGNIQLGYPFFGHETVTAAKLLWDFTSGWALACPQMFNSIYLDLEKSATVRKVTGRFFSLSRCMQRLFIDWAAAEPSRLTFDFIDYLSIPFLSSLRQRNLQVGKSTLELIADLSENMERLEELAQVLFLLAVEDVMPEQLGQFSEPVWLNAWSIGLNPEKWDKAGLLKPQTRFRDLRQMRAQIRSQFHLKSNCSR